MPFLYVAVLFLCSSVHGSSVAQQFISKLHICGAFLRISIAAHIHSWPRCSVPLRLLTVLFQYDAFLSYSAAFRSHSLAHLLRAAPFRLISVLLFSIASPLPAVLVLIRSARFCGYALLICSMPALYISLLCLCLSRLCLAFSSLRFSSQLNTFAKRNFSFS